MSKSRAILFLALLLTGGCRTSPESTATLPYYRTTELTPEWIDRSDRDAENLHRIGDFRFSDQDGRIVSSADFDGRIYVANFFFVHCSSVCPTMRSNMAKVQAAFDDVLLISHSVMPEADSMEALHAYAKANGVVSGRWHLVTGDKDEIYALARDSYFADIEEEVNGGFLHTETLILVDPQRHIRGVYNGTLAFDVQRLIEDIAVLKHEFAA